MDVFRKDKAPCKERVHAWVKKFNAHGPDGKNFLCDQNLELPQFLRPIFAKIFPSLEKL